MAYLFSKLNPNLQTDGPETLKTAAAYMPLSQKPKYDKTVGGFLLQNLPEVAVFMKLGSLFKKKKYTSGQHVLGERFLDHVQGLNVGRGDVPDDAILAAMIFFTIAFGVRITTAEDLDSLDNGTDAYYKRPDTADIPQAAVSRAVSLKRAFYAASTYNKGVWDLTHFQDAPLVAPIPGIENNTLMNGGVPGIGPIVNGIPENPDGTVIPGAGALDKVAQASASTTSTPSTVASESLASTAATTPATEKNFSPYIKYGLIGLGVLIIGVTGYFAFRKNK